MWFRLAVSLLVALIGNRSTSAFVPPPPTKALLYPRTSTSSIHHQSYQTTTSLASSKSSSSLITYLEEESRDRSSSKEGSRSKGGGSKKRPVKTTTKSKKGGEDHHHNHQQPPNPLNKELGVFRRNRRNGAQLAHQRLDVALKERDANITEKSFNTVFLAYAGQSGRGDWMAPLRSEQLLQKMKRHSTVKPSVFSYNAVMEAWVKSATPTRHHSNKNSKKQGRQHKQQQQPHQPHQPHKQRSIVQAKNTVLRLFDEMTKERKDQPTLKPNTYSYNLVLELYAKSPNPHDLRKAEDWFLNMDCEPDKQTFNLMFAAHANHGKSKQATWLLNGLIEDYLNFHQNARIEEATTENPASEEEQQAREKQEGFKPEVPSQVWFHCVLKACAQDQKTMSNSNNECGEQADQLLSAMHQLHREEQLDAVCPDSTTYNHVINVHAQAGNIQRVSELLKELEQIYSHSGGQLNFTPDVITYTTALKAYANHAGGATSHETEGTSIIGSTSTTTEQAEELFQRMQDLAAAGRPNMNPSIVTYNTIIQIYAKTGLKEDLKKATALLEQMQKGQSSSSSASSSVSFLPGLPRPPPPNAQTFTAILHGWSRTRNVREAGYRAEELLHMLERLPPNARRNLNWTLVFNSVITAWSKSGDKAAPQRVEALLNLLEDKCFESAGSVAPDKTTFLCIADAYAKARIPDAEQRCDDLLVRIKRLEEAGVVSQDLLSNRALYNSILNALAKSGQPSSKDKAEEILTMMQTSPNMNLRPDIVTYATVIDCHTKSGSNKTAERAEELLRFVEGNYRNGDTLLKPNAVFYSGILQAWAKTATLEGAEKAEWLLRRNEGLYRQGAGYEYTKPHAIIFNAVMDSIARSGMPEAGVRAEELLQEMMSLYEAGDEEMKPTRRSFNAVMLAYRHDGQGAEKAEKLLDRMEELADTAGDFTSLYPDVVSYNCAIQAIVEDNKPEDQGIAASRAQALLDRMEDRSIRPDATTYSCVIEAWLKCNNEKGSVMAELMLQKFLDLVESTKDWEARLDTEIVWDVINSYRNSD